MAGLESTTSALHVHCSNLLSYLAYNLSTFPLSISVIMPFDIAAVTYRNKIFNIFSSYNLTISLTLHALLINSERGNIQRADLDVEDGVLLIVMMRSDQD